MDVNECKIKIIFVMLWTQAHCAGVCTLKIVKISKNQEIKLAEKAGNWQKNYVPNRFPGRKQPSNTFLVFCIFLFG